MELLEHQMLALMVYVMTLLYVCSVVDGQVGP